MTAPKPPVVKGMPFKVLTKGEKLWNNIKKSVYSVFTTQWGYKGELFVLVQFGDLSK